MSLSYYKLAVILDKDGGGQNGAPNQALSIYRADGVTLATIYSDDAGTTPIAQPGAVTDAEGNFEFYALDGEYIAKSGVFELPVFVGTQANSKTFSSLSEVVDYGGFSANGINKGRVQGVGDFEIVDSNPDGYFVELTTGGLFIKPLGDQQNAQMYGITSSTTSASKWQKVFDDAVANGYTSVSISHDVASLDGLVDCKGIKILANGHSLPSAVNTFTNHGGIEDGLIAGVNTSQQQTNLTRSPTFEKMKFIRWESGRNFTVFAAKKNPKEGVLEILSEENIVTASNSIGGNSATRITSVKNISRLIAHKHTFDSATHTPVDTVTRNVGGGAEGVPMAFWDIPFGQSITFDPGDMISEVSIAFLLSGSSSSSMEIVVDGVVIDTISLAAGTGAPQFFVYRKSVTPTTGAVTINNTHASATGYVAGINAYSPADEIPTEKVALNLDYDTISYTYNSNDYTNSKGAVDYALRRHSDDYAGSDPTGGSFHGGETIASQSVRLDGGEDWTVGATVGDIATARCIEFVSSVNIVWPSDSASVNVVRINTIGDGSLLKDVRIIAGDMVFDAVWTTMWTTPETMTSARGLTARDISGVSSEFQCYDRGNAIRQDDNVNFGVYNSWTLFDGERNSNGGVYIASEDGTRAKLYYGPILFNKGTIGTIHTQQYTEFFGLN